MRLEIALMGNPNSGKTTLFNELTGDNKSVGNWTGVTVTLEIGHFHYQNKIVDIVDLPGIYSLFTHSPEQLTACEYLLNYHPDVIINVVDATNLERNLYLTTQLLETGAPVVVALNMCDELAKEGLALDVAELSRQLGVPCIRISAAQRFGLDNLLQKAVGLALQPHTPGPGKLAERFPAHINAKLAEIQQQADFSGIPAHISPRWAALQMLEEHWPGDIPTALQGMGDSWEAQIGEERYRIVAEIVARVNKLSPPVKRHQLTRRLDAVLCHRLWSLPVFFCLMLMIFGLSFGPPGSFVKGLFESVLLVRLPDALASGLAAIGAGEIIRSLLVEGIIFGVGGVLVFLPQLMILFFCLALLEFSGYMARAAFLTDKLLARFGLSGMSFIPMILGFGCSVPAIMATRALENKRERLLTMTVIPFMSCGARMPVYALFAGAFFARGQSLIIFSLYLLGVAVGLATAALLRPLIMKKEQPLFLMEMPPYRKPLWHCVGRTVWVRAWDFISRAGTILLIASIIIWFLNHFTGNFSYSAEGADSLLQNLGQLLTPLFAPLGFGYWPFAVALLCGFMAKEAVVASLSVLLAGQASLAITLPSLLSPAAAYAFLVFVLLYIPCIATVAAIKRESGGFKFLAGYIAYQLSAAWLISFIVFRLALLFA
jgi:ferrous iron transport protein B